MSTEGQRRGQKLSRLAQKYMPLLKALNMIASGDLKGEYCCKICELRFAESLDCFAKNLGDGG